MRRQGVQVGHELRMHLDAPERLAAAQIGIAHSEPADQLLDSGVDVGAVERGDARIGKGDQVADRILAGRRAVAARQLPAAAYDARDFVIRRKPDSLHGRLSHRAAPPWSGRG